MAESQTASLLVRAATGAIRLWQWQAPFWGARCRFYPSCSEYMREALHRFGFWKGLLQGTARLLKCHPWHPGGVDFVNNHHGK